MTRRSRLASRIGRVVLATLPAEAGGPLRSGPREPARAAWSANRTGTAHPGNRACPRAFRPLSGWRGVPRSSRMSGSTPARPWRDSPDESCATARTGSPTAATGRDRGHGHGLQAPFPVDCRDATHERNPAGCRFGQPAQRRVGGLRPGGGGRFLPASLPERDCRAPAPRWVGAPGHGNVSAVWVEPQQLAKSRSGFYPRAAESPSLRRRAGFRQDFHRPLTGSSPHFGVRARKTPHRLLRAHRFRVQAAQVSVMERALDGWVVQRKPNEPVPRRSSSTDRGSGRSRGRRRPSLPDASSPTRRPKGGVFLGASRAETRPRAPLTRHARCQPPSRGPFVVPFGRQRAARNPTARPAAT